MLQDGETIYKLIKPFEKHAGGDLVEFITLHEPTGEHSKFYRKLKQMVGRAQGDLEMRLIEILGGADKAAEKANDIQTAGGQIKPISEVDDKEHEAQATKDFEELKRTMIQSGSVDFDDFVKMFRNMVIAKTSNPVATLNESAEPLKSGHWDKISPDDQDEMSIWWCSFFVTPSIRGRSESEKPIESADTVKDV